MTAKLLLLTSLVGIASPAAAQQDTQCTTTLGVVNCITTGSPTNGGINWGIVDPNAFQRGFDQAKGAADSAANTYRQSERDRVQREQMLLSRRLAEQAHAQSQAITDQQVAAKALGVRAGQLVAAGDCSGAQKLALDAGDFDLANAVKGYCAK